MKLYNFLFKNFIIKKQKTKIISSIDFSEEKNKDKNFVRIFKIFLIIQFFLNVNFYMQAYAKDVKITYIQHDGFIIEADSLTFYTDITQNPGISFPKPDIIFITHNHADHFVSSVVTNLAMSSGALVVGPQPVISALGSLLPSNQLTTYAPATGAKTTASLLGINLTIYGSYDGTSQNSYRLGLPSGVVIYINGDMHESLFSSFVNSGGCNELLNMNIVLLDSWAYNIGNFYANYNPDIMIEMHKFTSPCVVYTNYPTSINLNSFNSYIYNYSTSINDNQLDETKIMVSPNPSNDYFNIHFANPENRKYNLYIYNSKEQLVKKYEEINSNEIKIESENLEAGIYFLQLKNNEEKFRKSKFIILK